MHRHKRRALALGCATALTFATTGASATELRLPATSAGAAQADYCQSEEALVIRSRWGPVRDTDIEEKVTQYLSCCPQSAVRAQQMACVDNSLRWLAYAHNRQGRGRQRIDFSETATSVTGGAALVIGGAKAAASTTTFWSVVALAPILVEDIAAYGPRSQVHYGAVLAFNRLRSHYAMLDKEFAGLDALDVQSNRVSLACADLPDPKDIKAKGHDAALELIKGEIAGFKAYCDGYKAALEGFGAYRDAMQVAYAKLPEKYANDAQALEMTFHKINFRLQAPPSKAFQLILSAPLDALNNAIRGGKAVSEYKAQVATFDLEKDGLPLSPVWPLASAPEKSLPTEAVTVSKGAQTALAELGPKNAAAKTAVGRLQRIAEASAAVVQSNKAANASVAALREQNGTYKMVFDFRAEKRSADVEFAKAGSDKK